MGDYEQMRLQRIKDNLQELKALNLPSPSQAKHGQAHAPRQAEVKDDDEYFPEDDMDTEGEDSPVKFQKIRGGGRSKRVRLRTNRFDPAKESAKAQLQYRTGKNKQQAVDRRMRSQVGTRKRQHNTGVTKRARGRPKELPDHLPRVHEDVVLDESLVGLQPRSSRSVLREHRDEERRKKQERRAKELAIQKEGNRLKQLLICCNKQDQTVKAALLREKKRVEMLEHEADQVTQLKAALASGTVTQKMMDELPVSIQKKISDSQKKKRPHTTVEERHLMRSLRSEFTERQIAARVGVAPSTVSYHFTHPEGRTNHAGRKPKLTKEMLWAAARFRFLFNQCQQKEIVAFLKRAYGVEVCERTLSRHLKSIGFRPGDFKRYPRDRNSTRAIQQRYDFAKNVSKLHGELTLHKALYSDEFSLVEVHGRKAWSIAGWFPCVVEHAKLTGKHITVLVVGCPELGVIHWELIEGSIDAVRVKNFYEAAVTKYLSKSWVPKKKVGGVTVPEFDYDITEPRLFIIDNASQHHKKLISEYFKSDVSLPSGAARVSDFFDLMYLPIYSPFLNPLEECFNMLHFRAFRKLASAEETPCSRARVKEIICQEVDKVKKDELHAFQQHQQHFIDMALERQPVYSQSHYEDSHLGDESSVNAEIMKKVDILIAKYLPDSFEGNTALANAQLHEVFDRDMITPDDLEAYNAQNSSSSV